MVAVVKTTLPEIGGKFDKALFNFTKTQVVQQAVAEGKIDARRFKLFQDISVEFLKHKT